VALLCTLGFRGELLVVRFAEELRAGATDCAAVFVRTTGLCAIGALATLVRGNVVDPVVVSREPPQPAAAITQMRETMAIR
jgi:hypothetical protein